MLAEHEAWGYADVRANTVASFALGGYAGRWLSRPTKPTGLGAARRHVARQVPFYTAGAGTSRIWSPTCRKRATAGWRPDPRCPGAGRCRTGPPRGRGGGRRGAQVAHQVHDAVQLVGLEGEDPLVVAQRERRRPCWPARRRSRAPSCRARRAGRGAPRRAAGTTRRSGRTGRRRRRPRASSSARNAGTWLLLNSAGRCSAICDQTGLRWAPSAVRRSRPYASCSASAAGGVPPDHEVGVGAQARDVVGAADHDVLRGQLRRTARRPRPAQLVAGRRASGRRGPEHRPHRVADDVVELADPRGVGLLLMSLILPCASSSVSAAAAPRRDAGRDADAVIGGAGERPARWAAGRRGPRRPGRRGPTAYCGRPPPQRDTAASTRVGQRSTPRSRGQLARTRSTRSASVRCSTCSSPCAADEARTSTEPGAAQVRPLLVEERDRLHREPLRRRHQEPGQLGQHGARGSASVTSATLA